MIALATGTDCTLVDGWPDVPHAPRHVLADVLKAAARNRRRARRLEWQRRRLRPTHAGKLRLGHLPAEVCWEVLFRRPLVVLGESLIHPLDAGQQPLALA